MLDAANAFECSIHHDGNAAAQCFTFLHAISIATDHKPFINIYLFQQHRSLQVTLVISEISGLFLSSTAKCKFFRKSQC